MVSCSETMMAKPINTSELHCPNDLVLNNHSLMIQFLTIRISSNHVIINITMSGSLVQLLCGNTITRNSIRKDALH